MTNWKTFREEILDITNKLVQEQNYVYEEALFSAIRKVYAREMNINLKKELIHIPSTIDWLTQEAKPKCETCFYKNLTCKNRTDCTVNGYRYWKPAQEAESNHIGEVNEMVEPQRSKARFIETKHPKGTEGTPLKRYINISNAMPNITCIDEDSYFGAAIISNNEIGFIRKPINEVIQQLGIEVV